MNLKNETMLLRDETVIPSDEVLKNALGDELFAVYQKLTTSLTDEFGMEPQWRYYNDGKAWLCKIVYKKKTILWLSVWENCIKTSFYFTEKTRAGVMELAIDPRIKEMLVGASPIGKLIPLGLEIRHPEQLEDLKSIIKYKKDLK